MTPAHDLGIDAVGLPKRRYTILDEAEIEPVLDHLRAGLFEIIRKGRAAELTSRVADRMSIGARRTLNKLCGDIARQVEWVGKRRSKDSWRHMLIAAYRRDSEVVPLPGHPDTFVVLGGSSLDVSAEEASGLLEFVRAFGGEHSVKWSAYARDLPTIQTDG